MPGSRPLPSSSCSSRLATRLPTRSGMPSHSSRPGPGRPRTTLTAGCGNTPTSSRSRSCWIFRAGPAAAPRCGSSSAVNCRTPARPWTPSRSATTATKPSPPTQRAGSSRSYQARHRAYARVQDRIHAGKDTGIGHLPSRRTRINNVWVELALIAVDLLALAQTMLLTDQPELHRAELKTLHYRLLHTATRLTRGQRKVFLPIAEHWPWALALARALKRLRQTRSRPDRPPPPRPSQPHEHRDTGHRAGTPPCPDPKPDTLKINNVKPGRSRNAGARA